MYGIYGVLGEMNLGNSKESFDFQGTINVSQNTITGKIRTKDGVANLEGAINGDVVLVMRYIIDLSSKDACLKPIVIKLVQDASSTSFKGIWKITDKKQSINLVKAVDEELKELTEIDTDQGLIYLVLSSDKTFIKQCKKFLNL